MNKEREAFEKYIQTVAHPHRSPKAMFFTVNDGHGNIIYADSAIQDQWITWQAAKAQAIPDGLVVVPETNISFKDWISDHKNDYVHFGGYQERAHELANRAWNASANTSTPKDKVLMPKKLSTKHIDYVVKELAITGGISLIEEVYQCLIEAQEPTNDN